MLALNEFKSIYLDHYNFINENYNEFEWDLENDNKLYLQLKELVAKNYNSAIFFLKRLLQKLLKFKKIKILKRVIITAISILSFLTVQDLILNIDDEVKIPQNIKKEIYSYLKKLNKDDINKDGAIKQINKDYKFNLFNAPTTYSDDLLDLMKEEEGYRNTAYDIGDGMITIGYGHAERKNKTDMIANATTITKQQAEDFLKEDLESAKNGLNRLLKRWKDEGIKYNITQGMYDAMISLIYNAGIGNFLKSKFIQLVKHGKYDEAAEKLKTTYVSYPGHVTRRLRESELFSKK